MKKLSLLISILILMGGCGKDKPAPVVPDPVYSSHEIQLFKQSLPIKREVLHKAYKKISPKIGLSNMHDFEGKSFDGEFVFDEKNLPFVEYRFDKPYIIKKIYLKGSGFVVDGKAKNSNIRKYEILFLDAQKTPSYIGELKEDATEIDAFDNVQAQGFILKTRSVYIDEDENIKNSDIIAGFDARIEVEVIDTDYVYDIIRPVLSERKSDTSNEELLKTIALMNTELFKRLRAQRGEFNLPKTSVLYLPEDADMNYAVAHTQEIYETGKYKTTEGLYKIHIFNDDVEFNDKEKVKVKQHKINVKKSKRNLKITEELPDHEQFIDFSEGI
jgi:hypothetical protein